MAGIPASLPRPGQLNGCARRVADTASGRARVRERGQRSYAQALEDRGDLAVEQAADLSHVRVAEAAEQVGGQGEQAKASILA